MMRVIFLLLIVLGHCAAYASNDIHGHRDPYEVRIVSPDDLLHDGSKQYEIRQTAAWQAFVAQNSEWKAVFDESSGLPTRAMGPAIETQGADAHSRALHFIASSLDAYKLPWTDLVLATITDNGKHQQVFMGQTYEGLEVMYSQAMVKMLLDGRVISWSASLHDDIAISVSPTLSATQAMEHAQGGITSETTATVLDELKVLPIPTAGGYTYHLVYEVVVETTMDNGLPARYRCHVDAQDGTVLQRVNEIHTLHTGCLSSAKGHGKCGLESIPPLAVEATFVATTIDPNPSEPSVVLAYPHMQLDIDGDIAFTDAQGQFSSPIEGPVDVEYRMSGRYAIVESNQTGGNPIRIADLQAGSNEINMDGLFSNEELAGYYSTTRIHDFMKSMLPSFTGLDFPLPVNLNITASPLPCNAFYNGASINFYLGQPDCVSLVLVSDIVYHEYGHAINDLFYQSQGAVYSNAAMNEGYADVWGFMTTEDPLLGDGHNPTDPQDLIRRYDIDPKVYPEDLVGQRHADGEIIAGAWWDVYRLAGNDIAFLKNLFALTYTGLQANTFNGNEGVAYLNVFIDALEADDDDGNILNGTPNGDIISEAFALHGITFLTTAEIAHEPVTEAISETEITINATVNISPQFMDYQGDLTLVYGVDNEPLTTEVSMQQSSGSNNYSATIPEQAEGTIVAYYIRLKDIYDNTAVVNPIGAHSADSKLPFYTLIGYDLIETSNSDGEEEVTTWEAGTIDDNATAGIWEEVEPIGSFNNGVPVAADQQTTQDGEKCWVTGNSLDITDGVGANDVDGGTTTLISGEMDMTAYSNPVFSYMRWYTNATGANPNADWWQVQVSDDAGGSWVYVENTRESDARWRRKVFKITDYVNLTDEFMIKFNASDSLRPGTALDGASLVEAALDDFKIYEISSINDLSESSIISDWTIYPNPVVDELSFNLHREQASAIQLYVYDTQGRLLHEDRVRSGGLDFSYSIDTSEWAQGQYRVVLILDDGVVEQSFAKE